MRDLYQGLLPSSFADAILRSKAASGSLHFRVDNAERVAVVAGFGVGGRSSRGKTPWLDQHFSRAASRLANAGFWYRVVPGLHELSVEAARRGAGLRLDAFVEGIPSGWQVLGHGERRWVIGVSLDDVARPTWGGWLVSHDEGARWWPVQFVDEAADLLEPVAAAWPLADLASERVVMIGVGSIGSAAAESLCAYGVRRLDLVDPDRLLEHNFARHRVARSELGRWKVNAVADRLQERDPAVQVGRYPINAIEEADVLRGLLKEAAAVLVSADGVAPRRVANHLAVRAGVPAIFACVLEDGAIGELVRVRPGGACLWCLRSRLRGHGALDPEPRLDRGYGTGTRHRPMTAVGGDLGIVGDHAAKALVATLLERRGHRGQRLAGDHAVIGLRPGASLPPPFDLGYSGEMRWRAIGPADPDCPSCSGQ